MAKQNWTLTPTELEGVYFVESFYAEDDRGYFAKHFEKEHFTDWGLEAEIAEQFETLSTRNVVRGLHFQTHYPQGKIVRCVRGSIFDVLVDLRRESRTFGQWRSFHLSEERPGSLIVPKGMAHGFMVTSDSALVSYTCVGRYYPEYDTGIYWNDSDLSVRWPIADLCSVICSEKDSGLPTYAEFIEKHGGF